MKLLIQWLFNIRPSTDDIIQHHASYIERAAIDVIDAVRVLKASKNRYIRAVTPTLRFYCLDDAPPGAMLKVSHLFYQFNDPLEDATCDTAVRVWKQGQWVPTIATVYDLLTTKFINEDGRETFRILH